MRPAYKKSQSDWAYLETQGTLCDQVEEVDWFESFLKCPTKRKATELYHMRIDQWFEERKSGRYYSWDAQSKKPECLNNKVKQIALRHGCET